MSNRTININSKQILVECISRLPIEKRKAIVELLHEACMAINSVECHLINTELEQTSLLDGDVHQTLWCQVYKLKKMFETI